MRGDGLGQPLSTNETDRHELTGGNNPQKKSGPVDKGKPVVFKFFSGGLGFRFGLGFGGFGERVERRTHADGIAFWVLFSDCFGHRSAVGCLETNGREGIGENKT